RSKKKIPVEGGAPLVKLFEFPAAPELSCPLDTFVPLELLGDVWLVKLLADCWTIGLPWATLTMMSPNSSGVESRPSVLMANGNCWPFGTGCCPICPAATWRFCWEMAVRGSIGWRLSAASLAGSSQARRL